MEAAICLPIVLYLLVAVGDFGRFYTQSARLDEVAMAAARSAATQAQPSVGEAAQGAATIRVETFCGCPTEPESRFACGEKSCGDYGEPAHYVQASAQMSFGFLSRYPGFTSAVELERTATVRTR
ncbi:MAG: pilus assembly protein [Acidobacteria bacterium]|nr:pilus assembly protein [Acidobacteriota bacterium]